MNPKPPVLDKPKSMRLPATTRTGASTLFPSTKKSLSLAAKCALPLGFLALASSAASAAILTFSTPTIISGDTDVNNSGTTDLAVYFNNVNGTTSETVNGVTFLNALNGNYPGGFNYGATLTSPNVNGYYATLSADSVRGFAGFTSTSAAYSNLSTSYQGILAGAAYAQNSTTALTFTLYGLTMGTEYQLQLFVEDPRNTALGGRSETLAAGNTSGTLLFGNGNGTGSDGSGATGDDILATFTADAPTQTITLNGDATNEVEQINAFNLETVVPEPSTFCLLGLLMLGSAVWLFRRPRKEMVCS